MFRRLCLKHRSRLAPLLGLASSLSQLSQRLSGGLESHDIKAGLRYLPLILVSAQATPQASPLTQLVDTTGSTGIKFEHLSSPEQKYIVESMSGGVALIDYDRDDWRIIYFTNAQSVDMALVGKKARSALYHNNHDIITTVRSPTSQTSTIKTK